MCQTKRQNDVVQTLLRRQNAKMTLLQHLSDIIQQPILFLSIVFYKLKCCYYIFHRTIFFVAQYRLSAIFITYFLFMQLLLRWCKRRASQPILHNSAINLNLRHKHNPLHPNLEANQERGAEIQRHRRQRSTDHPRLTPRGPHDDAIRDGVFYSVVGDVHLRNRSSQFQRAGTDPSLPFLNDFLQHRWYAQWNCVHRHS